MSDRIVVMNEGGFEQIGPPDEVYHEPSSLFVADFIGKANIFDGTVTAGGDDVVEVDTGEAVVEATADERLETGTEVGVVVRPEGVSLERIDGATAADGGDGTNATVGEVNLVQMLGGTVEYRVYTEGGNELIVTTQTGDERSARLERGDRVRIAFRADQTRVLATESVVGDVAVEDRRRREAEV